MRRVASKPPDPLNLVRTLDPDAIASRLATQEAEASALRVLLRSARARQNARQQNRRGAGRPDEDRRP